jgi:hypothetical protein
LTTLKAKLPKNWSVAHDKLKGESGSGFASDQPKKFLIPSDPIRIRINHIGSLKEKSTGNEIKRNVALKK